MVIKDMNEHQRKALSNPNISPELRSLMLQSLALDEAEKFIKKPDYREDNPFIKIQGELADDILKNLPGHPTEMRFKKLTLIISDHLAGVLRPWESYEYVENSDPWDIKITKHMFNLLRCVVQDLEQDEEGARLRIGIFAEVAKDLRSIQKEQEKIYLDALPREDQPSGAMLCIGCYFLLTICEMILHDHLGIAKLDKEKLEQLFEGTVSLNRTKYNEPSLTRHWIKILLNKKYLDEGN